MLQNFILAVYRKEMVRRFIRTRAGSRLFVVLYDIYKDRIEAVRNGR